MKNINIKSDSKSGDYKVLVLFLSCALAAILSLIPWEYLRSAEYYDRANYISYIDSYLNRVQWFDFSGIVTKISYEWGWHYFLDVMESGLGLDSGAILFIVSLFVLTVSFLLISSKKNFLVCLFLLNPLYIDFFYSQIRLSFAIAFIFLSIMAFEKHKILSLLLIIPALFIHTSSFLFIFIFYSAIFVTKATFIGQKGRLGISLLVGLIASLAAGPYMSVLLGTIDDRRVEYENMASPFLYIVFWLGLFVFFMLKFLYKKTANLNHYYTYISISVLTMVVLNVFLTGYSSRFLAASFPFLALAMSELKGKNESIVGVIYVFYTLILWIFWMT